MSLYYAMCFQAGSRAGKSQQSIRILAHIRLAAVLPFFLVEQLSISYKHGLHLANLRSKVLVAHWRALSLMGRQCHCGWEDSWGKACRQHHSHDDLISVNRAWLLTQPQWEWAQGWGSSSPRGILLWPMGCGLGASLRESAGFIHSLQACPPLRGATLDSICSQFWQGSLIMS